MPRIIIPIPDVYEEVERRIAMAMSKLIVEVGGIQKDIPISYPGWSEQRTQQNSVGIKNDQSNPIRPSTTSKLSITMSEEYVESDYLTTTVHQQNNLNLFADGAIPVRMAPIYLPTEGTLTVTYRCLDLKEATAFRDYFRIRCSENRGEFILKAKYHYGFPIKAFAILEEIHRLRENVAGYGDTLADWIKNHISEKMSIVTTQAGTQPLMVFNEEQDNIVAFFDFTEPPEIQSADNGAVRTVDFTFKYRYEKPAYMLLKYPLVIHQQILGEKFRGDVSDKSYSKMQGSKSIISQNYDYFRNLYTKPDGMYVGVRIPYYDDWENPNQHQQTFNIVTALMAFRSENVGETVDLNELPNYQLAPLVKQFFEENPAWITKYTASPFLVTVFKDDVPVSEDLIEMDSNLVVHFNFPMTLRNTYHIQISLLANLTIIENANLEKLREYPDLCKLIFQAFFPGDPVDVKYVGGKLFPKIQFWEYIRRAHNTPGHYKFNPKASLNLVGQFAIQTWSER